MTHYIYILGDSSVKIWGLSGRERLIRLLNNTTSVVITDDLAEVPAGNTVILLRGDYLIDQRLLDAMLQADENLVLYTDTAHVPVAVRTVIEGASVLCEELMGRGDGNAIASITGITSQELESMHDNHLRKYDLPHLLPITDNNKEDLETELFAGSYKGVTDFITKWFWPVPAQFITRLCVRYNIKPNYVTLLNLGLVIVVCAAFWNGYFVSGLCLGWIMTFMDTVDGKLARVTLSTTNIGHILDHGLDIIHPPLWYTAWAMGLISTGMYNFDISVIVWLIMLGYIGGRLCEGIFEMWIAPFSFFLWQPFDSYNRLFTARRNPNMVFLTITAIAGNPAAGLWLTIAWHFMSTLILAIRITQAWHTKQTRGPLSPWFENVDIVTNRDQLAVRIFTRVPLEFRRKEAVDR